MTASGLAAHRGRRTVVGVRWVVYGAGAVGGVLGGRMYDAGLDVVLVARGEHLSAIRDHGLTLASPEGTTRLPVPVVGDASEVDWREPCVVLLTVKSHQSAAALDDLVGSAPADVVVVCVQNGVANEQTALRYFDQVQGTCVMMPTAHLESGIVQAHCAPVAGILDTGRFPDGVDAITDEVVDAFRTAGFVSEPRPDVMAWKYRKLIMNLANAVQACCGSGSGTDELSRRVRAEGEAVLSAAHVAVVSEEADRERRGDILRRRQPGGHPASGGSSWQSLRRATGSIESDYLNGEIVLLGRLHGTPTPANLMLQQTATRLAREGAEPGSVDPSSLLAELDGM